MKKFLLVPLTLCLLAFLVSCGQEAAPTSDQSTSAAETVDESHVLDDQIAIDEPIRRIVSEVNYHEGYTYYAEQYGEYHIFKRINLANGEVSSPCADPLCTHTSEECAFFCGNTGIPSIKFFDEWCLVQSGFRERVNGLVSVRFRRILYNIHTKKWVEIFRTDGNTLNDQSVMRIDDCLYHVSYGAKRSSNGKIYMPCEIQRYNLKTGKEDVIYSHEYDIKLMMAGENRLYLYETLGEDYHFYSVDKNGKDFREEPTISIPSDYIYQNRVYSCSPPKATYPKDSLVVQNTKTGEITVIADEHVVGSLCVTEDAVYYLYKEYYVQSFEDVQAVQAEAKAAGLHAYTSEPYKSRMEEIHKNRNTATAYLWRCALDGTNPEMVLEMPGAGALELYIRDGYLYTTYEFYDIETGERLGTENEQDQPCRIDLTTGEVEFLHKLGAE